LLTLPESFERCGHQLSGFKAESVRDFDEYRQGRRPKTTLIQAWRREIEFGFLCEIFLRQSLGWRAALSACPNARAAP